MKCEKCNAPLDGSMAESGFIPTDRKPASEMLKGTVPESGSSRFKQSEESCSHDSSTQGQCPRCGYPIGANRTVCPNCGANLKSKDKPFAQAPTSSICKQCGNLLPVNAKFCPVCGKPLYSPGVQSTSGIFTSGTVNNWSAPQQDGFCTLKPLAWQGEEVQYPPITYSGKAISLNRSNTDPNNHTITSKEQALLTHEGGSWYIEDRSEQRTTLIRVGKKTKLETGDVIVLGNRMFEFKG